MDRETVIITGASRGLGAAMAHIAAQMGANVVLAGRSAAALQSQAEAIGQTGGQALAVTGDVSREEDCREIAAQARRTFGRIDALINNGGVIEPLGPIAETSSADWQYNLAVNFLGPVMLTRFALPALRETGGRVINITTGAANHIYPGWGAYSSAKLALNQVTQILAAEEPALTAIAVLPGIVDTQMQVVIRETGKGKMAQSNYDRLAGLHQQGKLLPPDLPGTAIACLALYAPHDLSGAILFWDDERVQAVVKEHAGSIGRD
jgi:NAD(P)-dependent dehydrogenase (short-subunit alcohol dehydrogenase family)